MSRRPVQIHRVNDQDHGGGLGLIRIAAGMVALVTTSHDFKLKSRFLFPGLLLFVSGMGVFYSHIDDDLSARATRNLFSWMLFKEGTGIDDRQYWKHEWLSFLIQKPALFT
ncbi:hypothetical protein ARAM_007310 [Aspergillus rambellii]|uniref:Uncharacterized protein n=1 Tax=Aspergillus rambellii TaxID=308745 RepID=A0A0F8U063_9EURO|nr:hypothetical protein ARAM_007310 [Aspergillus rambellii]